MQDCQFIIYIIFVNNPPFLNMEEYILLCVIFMITNHQLQEV